MNILLSYFTKISALKGNDADAIQTDEEITDQIEVNLLIKNMKNKNILRMCMYQIRLFKNRYIDLNSYVEKSKYTNPNRYNQIFFLPVL